MDAKAVASSSGVEVCPLCGSVVRYYFIHFNYKILMCGNAACEYPFTNSDVVFTKEDPNKEYDQVVDRIKRPVSPSATQSTVSSEDWSEIERLAGYSKAEEQLAIQPAEAQEKKPAKAKKTPEEVAEEVAEDETTKQLVEELRKVYTKDAKPTEKDGIIKNEKWLKNLMDMQETSGRKLVKDEEMKILQESKQQITGLGEVMVDINMGASSSKAVIKIDIQKKN
ncbi:uncharacterized protein LOC114360821 [Ostrinia furnacalis]|uniref:uncharacterized protein LOC114360821 n=1 Tax=Ostrinia furnacalis TaxID=93504 RepID=UPI00103B4221|nr:uncharacterized protein LOC114360821 [Ostrinia furnacalis]